VARLTNTRTNVREAAQRILESGGNPTPTVIRAMLGGKGSPNTIVQELRKFMGEQQAPTAVQVSSVQAIERVGLKELAALLAETVVLNTGIQNSINELSMRMSAVSTTIAELEELKSIFVSLSNNLSLDKALISKELSGVAARFDSIQKIMLVGVDEAREAAKAWKQKYIVTRDDAETWRITMTQKLNKQQEELAYLKGKLERQVEP
jgi:hypothetical protein